MKYSNSIKWGNMPMGVLPHDRYCHIFRHSQQISGLVSCILAKTFIYSIIVYNKTYLHFHVTFIYLFEIFSTTIIASFGHDNTWQNRERPHAWPFTPRLFVPRVFFLTHTPLLTVPSEMKSAWGEGEQYYLLQNHCKFRLQ